MYRSTDDVIIGSGLISPQLLAEVERSRRDGEELSDLLIQHGLLSEGQILSLISRELDIPIHEGTLPEPAPSALMLLDKAMASKYQVLPLSVSEDGLLLAVAKLPDIYALEDIRQSVQLPIKFILCTKSALLNATEQPKSIPSSEQDMNESDVAVRMITTAISRGEELGASDIHIEPFAQQTYIRLRVDGMLTDLMELTSALHSALIARVKIMAGLDIAEHRLPQDGNIRGADYELISDLRISIMPTMYGEKAVLRFLKIETNIDRQDFYGMDERCYKKVNEMLNAPSGLIYFTGPTGSGKTTTLYMILEQLAKRPVNICTIEDPIERPVHRINQIAAGGAGMSFGEAFRAVLRQDPDIIMLGETRDYETAEISVRSAISGHLVLSTLHTADAVSAVLRLEDMGIAPYLAGSALVGVVAQRLLRKVCTHCSESAFATEKERQLIGEDIKFIQRGRGCPACSFTGYKGRIAIHEVLKIDNKLRRMITEHASLDEMYSYAVKEQGMISLRSAAVDLVKRGVTTPEEVLRAAYFTE